MVKKQRMYKSQKSHGFQFLPWQNPIPFVSMWEALIGFFPNDKIGLLNSMIAVLKMLKIHLIFTIGLF